MKKGGHLAALAVSDKACSVAFAGEGHDQLQQADENVVEIEVNRQRCADIIGFATLNDAADVVQDISGEDADGGNGNGQRQRRDLEEDVGDGGEQDQNQ